MDAGDRAGRAAPMGTDAVMGEIKTDPSVQVAEARDWVRTDSPEPLTPRMRNLLTWMADSIERLLTEQESGVL